MPAEAKKESKLKVVLCWHMHQPQYKDLATGEYRLPWTYLHATKDYVDMVAHLEAEPNARAVVNFAPILLEQIEEYATRIRDFLDHGTAIGDPLLGALAEPALPEDPTARRLLAEACLKANEQRLIEPYPRYAKMVRLVRWLGDYPDLHEYLSDQFLVDLLVWYHLAWMGETVRRSELRIKQLLEKGSDFTLDDRRTLLQVIGELLSGVLGRYRALADAGRIELSMTPYAHPIMPLLLSIDSTCEAMPDATLPQLRSYPGGEERVRWHLQKGLETFERHFGRRPEGCWPSEGSVSEATLALLGEFGFTWAATGETVLANSLHASGEKTLSVEKEWLHHPYVMDKPSKSKSSACFFRDDGLSDSIGFKYSDWHADDAVANFIHNLEQIAEQVDGKPDTVVSVILDGENAWEYYPVNGYYFLSALYRRLAAHPKIELTTYGEALKRVKPAKLKKLVAGSWVYGTFSTWIGDKDKNRGWDMLGDAKKIFDRAVADGRLAGEQLERATEQLAICEGSDWCWWFGDYNPAGSVGDFERLYRQHLANLYHMMGESPPEYLAHAFTHGGGSPATGGTMRQGQQH